MALSESIFRDLLSLIEENPKRLGLKQTPALAAAAFSELTQGYEQDPKKLLEQEKIESEYSGSIEIPDIAFISLCEHTFLPFFGSIHITYEPGQYLAGIGAFEALIQACSKRLTLQETLTTQIAQIIHEILRPHSIRVAIEAQHTCMKGQEVKTCIQM